MQHFPQLPLRTSLLYLRHPHRLVVEGRRLGPRWSFWHPVYGIVPVVSAQALAVEVLGSGLALADADRYIDWLGPLSPLVQRTFLDAPGPLQALRFVETAITEQDPHYYADRALRPVLAGAGDVIPGLRAAALCWVLQALCAYDEQAGRTPHICALAWREAARTIPLLWPTMRSWSRPYAGLALAKLRLLGALGDTRLGPPLEGRHGAALAGLLLTMLGPVVDALPMIAAAALTYRDTMFARRIERALQDAHPIPLLILEAKQWVQLEQTGLDLDPEDLIGCTNGRHIAVDLPGSGVPYGIGTLRGLMTAAVKCFTRAILGVASELDLVVVGAPQFGRVRLCFGATRLRMVKWPG